MAKSKLRKSVAQTNRLDQRTGEASLDPKRRKSSIKIPPGWIDKTDEAIREGGALTIIGRAATGAATLAETPFRRTYRGRQGLLAPRGERCAGCASQSLEGKDIRDVWADAGNHWRSKTGKDTPASSGRKDTPR